MDRGSNGTTIENTATVEENVGDVNFMLTNSISVDILRLNQCGYGAATKEKVKMGMRGAVAGGERDRLDEIMDAAEAGTAATNKETTMKTRGDEDLDLDGENDKESAEGEEASEKPAKKERPAKKRERAGGGEKFKPGPQDGSVYRLKPYDVEIDDDLDEKVDSRAPSATKIDPAMLASNRYGGVADDCEGEWREDADGNKKVRIKKGNRRFRHARVIWDEQRAAGTPEDLCITVRTIVRKVVSESASLFDRVRSNLFRADDDAVTQAENMERMLALSGNEEAVAGAFGVDVPQMKNKLKLLTLTPAVRKAVQHGAIPETGAIKLHKLSPEEQNKALAEVVEAAKNSGKEKASVNDVARAANGDAPVEHSGPSKTLLRKLLKAEVVQNLDSDDEALAIIRWVLGEIKKPPTNKVTWLKEALAETKDLRRKPAAK